MIREVFPRLYVGDGNAPDANLKAIAGYQPGGETMICADCGAAYLGSYAEAAFDQPRCLDCALKHIARWWLVVHAAKEPWHRATLGYTSRGAPQGPEYLVAQRGNEIALNLVDMPSIKPEYTDPMVDHVFGEMERAFKDNMNVLIHCNEGKSRAPTIALLWLGENDDWDRMMFDHAAQLFQETYPEFEPGAGMEAYARQRWTFAEPLAEADQPVQ